MITLVNVLFILIPFLLPVLVYFEHRANFMITNQDPILEHKPYTLLQLRTDIITLFVHVLMLSCPVLPGIIGWSYFSFIIIMIILLRLIPHDRTKIQSIRSLNMFNLFKQVIEAVVCGATAGVVSHGVDDSFILSIIIIIIFILFILFSIYVSRYHAKSENGTLQNMIAALALITSSALSRGLVIFLILGIMNYFFGLELYAFNI